MKTRAAPRAIARAETPSEAFSPSQEARELDLPAAFDVDVAVDVAVFDEPDAETKVAPKVLSDSWYKIVIIGMNEKTVNVAKLAVAVSVKVVSENVGVASK